jgi:hypothetical protein
LLYAIMEYRLRFIQQIIATATVLYYERASAKCGQ